MGWSITNTTDSVGRLKPRLLILDSNNQISNPASIYAEYMYTYINHKYIQDCRWFEDQSTRSFLMETNMNACLGLTDVEQTILGL